MKFFPVMLANCYILIATFSLLLSACSPPTPPPTRAFYHWQTALELTTEEVSFLTQLEVEKLYVKFFDVDWEESLGEPVPLAQVAIQPAEVKGLEIIPTVFITNQTMRQLPLEEVSSLAQRICDKIFELAEPLPDNTIGEIQIDCDWSGQSRVVYFRLLEAIKTLLKPRDITLSATIRLHQVKYSKQTGIPPVDRGMLMFYNVGQVEDWREQNSILNLPTARAYLGNLRQYPLELDLVLPVFAWGVLFRQGKMIKLINNLRPADLADTSRFHETEANRFEVIKSTYLNGYYLYRGDLIRTEAIPVDLLQETITVMKEELPSVKRTLAFYHLDTTTIKHYVYEDLEALFLEMVQE